jgi:lipopolysaccharide export system protein LptA
MYHRSIKYPLNSPEWSHIAERSEPKASIRQRSSTRVATRAPTQLPAMIMAARYYLRTRVFLGLQNLLLATSLSLCAPACFAEHADRDKPLLLEADQVLIDDIHKTSTFTGNVRLAQGTMLIRADKIEVLKYTDGFQKTKAYGNTASFRQKREASEEYLEGYGERIEYDTRTGTVDFYGQARVKRELDEVRGDHITYSMKTETFQVSGGASSVNTPPKRVRAVLQPRPKSDASTPSSQGTLDNTPGKTLATPE